MQRNAEKNVLRNVFEIKQEISYFFLLFTNCTGCRTTDQIKTTKLHMEIWQHSQIANHNLNNYFQ